jgi:hypothetical protein
MTPQLTPASGREDNGFPPPRTTSKSAPGAGLGSDLDVRPGESDPARMLSGVLLLVVATIITVLMWWLV